ncbi:TPA: 2-dehydropantoate 2-reductase [Thermoplasmata archaeon]|nr:2-dehydropantoate 2-reductase [Thermoplasmata archaeon]
MRICVYGAGSLGSAIGGLLADEHEVSFIGRPANVEAIRKAGLTIKGAVERAVEAEAHTSVEGLRQPELMLITTKSYNTRAVIEACRTWAGEGTNVLTLQNGLGNLELLREWKGRSAFGGTTTMGAVLEAPGIVRLSGVGRVVVGGDLDAGSAESLSSLFTLAGIPSSVSTDINGEIWAKAVVNASVNPLTAILGVRNGVLLESDTVSRLMSDICRECERVAEAVGVTLPPPTPYERVQLVARQTAGNRSSMLRDVELGRRTEIESINGYICRVGAKAGIPTPLNKSLVSMVQSLAYRPAEKG